MRRPRFGTIIALAVTSILSGCNALVGSFNNPVDPANITTSNPYASYTLSVASDGNGTVAINGGGSVSSTSTTVSWGTAVNLVATPSSGYVFSNWTVVSGSATIANASSALTTVTLNGGDASVRANFSTGSNPAISLSSGTLGFAATQGGSNPYSQTVIIQNSGSGTLNWSVNSNASWLSVAPASGSLPSGTWSTITVSTDITGLSATTYTGTLTVSGAGALNTPQSIRVALSVYGTTGGTLAWTDSFESYAVGSFPSAWTPDANASDLSTNYVTNSIASNGSNSLRLYGVVGGSWASITYRALNVTPTYRIAFDVYNGTETLSGAHPQRAEVGIRQGTSWVNPARQLIYFDQYGNVKDTTGATITTYSTAQWYHVEITYSRPDSATVSVTYKINGTTYPAVSTSAQSSESSMTNLELCAEEGSAWFDNVQVYQQ